MKVTEYTLVTPATYPALDLNDAKEHLKISGSDYDAQLLDLIAVTSSFAERITGRDLINKTYKGYLDCFPHSGVMQIRKSKLQSITSIQYYKDDVLTTLSASDYYITDEQDYSCIHIKEDAMIPTVDDRRQAVIITFVAGYGIDACDVPKLLKQAMLSQIATLFNDAGDCDMDYLEVEQQYKYLYRSFIISSNFLRVI